MSEADARAAGGTWSSSADGLGCLHPRATSRRRSRASPRTSRSTCRPTSATQGPIRARAASCSGSSAVERGVGDVPSSRWSDDRGRSASGTWSRWSISRGEGAGSGVEVEHATRLACTRSTTKPLRLPRLTPTASARSRHVAPRARGGLSAALRPTRRLDRGRGRRRSDPASGDIVLRPRSASTITSSAGMPLQLVLERLPGPGVAKRAADRQTGGHQRPSRVREVSLAPSARASSSARASGPGGGCAAGPAVARPRRRRPDRATRSRRLGRRVDRRDHQRPAAQRPGGGDLDTRSRVERAPPARQARRPRALRQRAPSRYPRP